VFHGFKLGDLTIIIPVGTLHRRQDPALWNCDQEFNELLRAAFKGYLYHHCRNYSLLSVSRDTPKNAAISCWALYYIIQGIILKVLHILLFLWDKRAQHNATD
jgi:hypothetical protein